MVGRHLAAAHGRQLVHQLLHLLLHVGSLSGGALRQPQASTELIEQIGVSEQHENFKPTF